jgi:transcriptional regulator with XRE-family HTH domain
MLMKINRLFSKSRQTIKLSERRSLMIYQKVVAYCEKNCMSVSAFEKKCDIGNGTVGRWKGDFSKPSLSTLEKMQKATGIPISVWIQK